MALRDSAIVGYAETKVVDKSERDLFELQSEILDKLLERTGVEKREIDGLVMSGLTRTGAGNVFWAQTTADVLGLEVDYCDQVHIGGCSATGAVARAAMAIDAGYCSIAFLLFADTPSEDNRKERDFRGEWTNTHGLMGPPGSFGLLAKRYEHLYGLDYSMLGKLAVTQRNHALLNDMACEKLRKTITVYDYLNSRMISEPIRLLDCVMPCDGATGLMMMSREAANARGLKNCVIPIGYAERTNYAGAEGMVDITWSGHKAAGERALNMAGMTVKDVASFHPYDDFIIAIMLQFENLGFCRHGEGPQFIRDHDLSFSGDLPLNTGGGLISSGAAACSSHNLIEGVRQLMGEGGARQVKDTRNALVTGIGWINYGRNWGSSAVMALVPNQ
jgi:acetyl-CoA acetyltransferase